MCLAIYFFTEKIDILDIREKIISRYFKNGHFVHIFKVAVNVSRGEQTFPQIMADFSLFVH